MNEVEDEVLDIEPITVKIDPTAPSPSERSELMKQVGLSRSLIRRIFGKRKNSGKQGSKQRPKGWKKKRKAKRKQQKKSRKDNR